MSSDNNQENGKPNKQGISRRQFLKAGAAGAAGLAVTAATPALAAPAKKPARRYMQGNPTTVRLWTWYIEQQDEFPKIISDFEAKNPNIKVDLQLKTDVTGAYLPALLAAASSGNVDD